MSVKWCVKHSQYAHNCSDCADLTAQRSPLEVAKENTLWALAEREAAINKCDELENRIEVLRDAGNTIAGLAMADNQALIEANSRIAALEAGYRAIIAEYRDASISPSQIASNTYLKAVQLLNITTREQLDACTSEGHQQ